MKRRAFIALLAGTAAIPLTAPLIATAQQRPSKIPRIGLIDDGPIWQPFRESLRQAGLVEGRTIAFEIRRADGEPARIAAAAAELAALPVDVIVTYGTPASRAAKAATATIPIVMVAIGDPVRAGLVQSLAQPGGNVTGNTILSPDLTPKRLQLVKEVIPAAKRVALLWNPDNVSNAVILEQMRAAAPGLDLGFTAVEARSAGEIENAFAILARERPDALLLTSDPLHHRNIQKIIGLMLGQGLPGMFQNRADARAGGLMSYGAIFGELFWQAGFFVQKILQGAKPASIPVQTPQRFELVINLKTAKALGIAISEAVLLRADEVIE
jgi:putative ABC transport system substrate-binding protein